MIKAVAVVIMKISFNENKNNVHIYKSVGQNQGMVREPRIQNHRTRRLVFWPTNGEPFVVNRRKNDAKFKVKLKKKKTMKVTLLETVTERFKFAS